MKTNAAAIKHLWTHKTQDHPWLGDEELLIDRAEGVWVWTRNGKRLLDGFAGLAVVNIGHGRREIAEAIAEQPCDSLTTRPPVSSRTNLRPTSRRRWPR